MTTVTETFLPTAPGGASPSGVVVFTLTDREDDTDGEAIAAQVNAEVVAGAMSVEVYPGDYVVQVMLTGLPVPHSRLATIPTGSSAVLSDCYTDTSPPT